MSRTPTQRPERTRTGAHAATEWVTLESLQQLTEIITATVAEFCA